MTITIYTKPDCVQCHATCRALDRKGISYRLVDLVADGQALAHVKSLGYQQVPVVQTPSEHWSGFRPDKISLLAAAAMAS
ncbi:glutaredoxin-like protein NrdH [Acerihabitans arboris]|uniref:Glutaredoxin-like protein NrdH n=1 Tax=Acerihabitans arboris TaxID=2691583 RepID=A0A845SL30_9GAMM|nr:glutaredoxin-like protein NrdH [Acerihabitans arboris]NDL63957.1 glutaredoxin-like protein NrdH [Acerihabitans arboris]